MKSTPPKTSREIHLEGGSLRLDWFTIGANCHLSFSNASFECSTRMNTVEARYLYEGLKEFLVLHRLIEKESV